MRKRSEKNQKVVKGMPSAVLLSLLIHAALFLLAGMLVVFTVVKKEEQKFEPPKAVERPKMTLRKPKVKVKKTSKPKPTTRIVTKVNRVSMPDIQLPEMSGMAEGLAGGIGGFDMMLGLDEVSVFGSGQSIGNDFVGAFYDLKRDRSGRPIPVSGVEYAHISQTFMKSGWKPSVLGRYWKSPKKIYTSVFMVPTMISARVPAMFGEPEMEGMYWVVHYKGQLVHKDGITFRFICSGDGNMVVRVNGEIVVMSGGLLRYYNFWSSSSPDHLKWWLGSRLASVGDWITLEPGVPLPMEVYITEAGAYGCFMLAIQEKGVEYPMRTMGGGPIFPAFRTSELSHDMLDAIYKNLVPSEVSLTNGPVFRDYGVLERADANAVEKIDPPETLLPEPSPVDPTLRTWTSMDGKTMEAEFVVVIGDRVVFKTPKGMQRKVPLAQLSAEDREYIELINPPALDIDFGAKTERVFSIAKISEQVPVAFDYRAKVKLTQTSTGEYNHELCVEFFAIGEEIHGNRFVLLDRRKSYFTPSAGNQRSHEFVGRLLKLPNFTLDGLHRGEKPYGYLVTVTDSRGEIIHHKASNAWLYENMENLKLLPVGAYMDKTCTRVFPTGPKRTRY